MQSPAKSSPSTWDFFVSAITPGKAKPDVYGSSNADASGSLDCVPRNLIDAKDCKGQNANLRLAIRAPLVNMINSEGLQASAITPGAKGHENFQQVVADILDECQQNTMVVTERRERAQNLNRESQRFVIEGNDEEVQVQLILNPTQQKNFKQLFPTLIEAQLEMNRRYKLNPDNPEPVQLKGQRQDRYYLYIECKKNGGNDEFILSYADTKVDGKSTFKLMFLANQNQYDWSKISGELQEQPLLPLLQMPARPLPPGQQPVNLLPCPPMLTF